MKLALSITRAGMPKLTLLTLLASLARLERATHCLEGSCSVLLSYRDTHLAYLA